MPCLPREHLQALHKHLNSDKLCAKQAGQTLDCLGHQAQKHWLEIGRGSIPRASLEPALYRQ